MLLLLPTDLSIATFSKNYFWNTLSDSLDPDQDRHSVGPDLGQNCLQRMIKQKFCMLLLLPTDFFQNQLFLKILSGTLYQSVKQFGTRSEPTFCRS